MILSADVFKGILKGLKTELAAEDKRLSNRIGIRARVTLVPFTTTNRGSPVQGWCRDISTTGIGILVSDNLKVGQQFILELKREDDEPMRLLCETVRKAKVDSDLFVIGARFLGPAGEKPRNPPVSSTTGAASAPKSPAPPRLDLPKPPEDPATADAEILRVRKAMLDP
jgi:hypothetical protein